MRLIPPFIIGLWLFVLPELCVAEFRGTLTATSNYIYRAYSRSNDEFAFQANFDYQHENGGYVGVSTATVDFADSGYDNPARFEVVPYLGWSFSLPSEWRLDMQWSRYLYDGNIFGKNSDYNEFYVFLHYQDWLSANISVSEDYYSRGAAAENYELTGRYPITEYIQVSGTGGYSYALRALQYNYFYWNAGMTFYYKSVALDFRYVDSYEVENPNYDSSDPYHFDPVLIKPSFLFTISVGF
ncbi:MAG: hypothetical protein HOP23_03900 [Methylococcaceae bacterium]|nr:hypothetical protein [Methylococcaceae bacterium]